MGTGVVVAFGYFVIVGVAAHIAVFAVGAVIAYRWVRKQFRGIDIEEAVR